MENYILAIDQGTTNSRTMIFNRQGKMVAEAKRPLQQFFPQDGWVEQNAEEMFTNTIACCKEALEKARLTAKEITAIGISNQRETTIIWDKVTGEPIYPAIVWQDRRTVNICKQLTKAGLKYNIQQKTGLLIDPYFSATKIMWLLDNVPNARERAEKGELLFGTVDCYLLWKLTGGKVHATDASNASRTMIFNIHSQEWDQLLLNKFNIPRKILPVVEDNAHHFGDIDANLLGSSIPILGIAGDQQAATIGQACFKKGMVKATYGTGCFMLLNTGNEAIVSHHKLLTTIAYRLKKKVTYGLEGSIFSADVAVKWLRDTLKLITKASETEQLAASIPDNGGVYLVPAFTGLGAPYWDPGARGSILGLTPASSRAHIVRAALESIAYQTLDLLHAMTVDGNVDLRKLRVDGGMTANNWLLQFLSNMLNLEVQRPVCIETSALGAAYLAGLQAGIYQSLDEIAELWQEQSSFHPQMNSKERESLYTGWQNAVERVITK